MIDPKEKICIENRHIYPKLSREIIKKTKFSIAKDDFSLILERIENGYGLLIDLNKELDLKLQYHGRFESFLIGIGTNPKNSSQPDIKLVRIDSLVESTHNKKKSIFFESEKIKGPHFHWYNYFYQMLVNKKNFDLQNPSKEDYQRATSNFLRKKKFNLDREDFKHACSFKKTIQLCKKLTMYPQELRIDIDISTDSKLKSNPKSILNQILSKEVF